MKNITGNWVTGDNFFGRKQELQELKEFLFARKTSCFIPGPRRIGKTSLVMEFIRLNTNKKPKIIYRDLEKNTTLIDFCYDIKNTIEQCFPGLNIDNTGQLEIDVIKEQYNELTSQSRICFNLFKERLKKYLPEPECLAARKILYHLARKELYFEDIYPQIGDLIEEKKKLNKLLQRLIDENYIQCTKSCYSFVSPVLKDWWKNYIKWGN